MTNRRGAVADISHLDLTGLRATVATQRGILFIITLLRPRPNAVAAGSRTSAGDVVRTRPPVFSLTRGGAAVSGRIVAVIALLSLIDDTIPASEAAAGIAGHTCPSRFNLAGDRTPVSR